MSPKEVISKWVHLLNTHEVDKLLELYDENAINIQVAVGKPLIGKAAIRDDFIEFFSIIPDTCTKAENLFQDGNWGIVEWTGGGTFMSKKPFTFEGCGFFKVLDGKIHFQRGYWDMNSWIQRTNLEER